MADLDDFFAKKDKKKSKSKKFATAEDLLLAKKPDEKKLENSSSKPKKEKPIAPAATGDGNEENSSFNDEHREDEWKEFEEEERKDYTGLKIGHLQINDDDSNEGSNGDVDGEGGSDGEGNYENSERKSGPWKKVAEVPPQQAVSAVQENSTQQSEKQTASKVYVTPALRMQQQQMQKSATKLRKGVLPDIHNEEYFPVLGSAKPEEVKKKKPDPGFEEVKHGSRIQKSNELSTNAPVAIGNRFNSLSDS